MPDSDPETATRKQKEIKANLEASRREKTAQDIRAARTARAEARKWRSLFFLILFIALVMTCAFLYTLSL